MFVKVLNTLLKYASLERSSCLSWGYNREMAKNWDVVNIVENKFPGLLSRTGNFYHD